MEWEKTVMSPDKIGTLGNVSYDDNGLMVLRGMNIKTVVEAQAEISYKAGYEAGLVTSKEIDIDLESERLIDTGRQEMAKEIIEFVEKHILPTDFGSVNSKASIPYLVWQVTCKEWLDGTKRHDKNCGCSECEFLGRWD
jgi:hypothetical protein